MAYHIDAYDKSLVVDGFENGIADSPFNGISDMRNVNIISVPGEASVNFEVQNIAQSALSGAVTAGSDADDTVTVTSVSNIPDGTTIIFAGGSLPAGVTAGTKYLIRVNTSGGGSYALRIYTSYANYLLGPAAGYQNITGTGTGTFTSLSMDKPLQRWFDSVTARYYFLDAAGRAWFTTSAAATPIYLLGNDTTATTNANGNGLAVYRGYLFTFRNDKIDYMKMSDGAWTYGWKTLNTASTTNNSHYAFYARTDYIFYCDGAYLGSFKEVPGATFDPATAATFQWNAIALSLPRDDIAQCLEELGTTLLIGGQKNAIYNWNQTDSTFQSRALVAESFIWRMQTVNTNTYVLAGQRGRVYITNGSQATLFKKVPDHLSGTIEPYFQWGDICSVRNQLYFSLQARNSASGSVIAEYGGLWAIDLDTTAIRLTNQLSFGTYAGLATAIIPIVPAPSNNPPFPTYSQGVSLYIGWDSGASTYGLDYSAAVPYTASEAYIDSDLIPIGTYEKPRNVTRIEYRLVRPLVSGESVTLQWRDIYSTSTVGTPGFTTVLSGTYDSSSGANNYSLSGPVNFKNAQWIQLRAILNSTTSSPSYVRLKELRLIGLVE